MTEKEIAEEYVDTLLNKDDTELDKFLDENLVGLKLNEKQAGTILGVIKGVGICSFLAGLKAGRPKWHDTEETPPEDKKYKGCSIVVLDENCTKIHKYENRWFEDISGNETYPLAWCELPKYKEE